VRRIDNAKLRLYTVQTDCTLTFVDILQEIQYQRHFELHWIDRYLSIPTTFNTNKAVHKPATATTNIMMMPRSSITLLVGTKTGWLQYKDHQP
jgi:hypothetical protein